MALSFTSTLANGEGRCVTAAVNTSTANTIACWFYMTSKLVNARIFDANSNTTGQRRIFITGTGNTLRYSHQFSGAGNNSNNDIDITALNLNTWYHLAVTYDGSNLANTALMYINGVSQTVTLTQPTAATTSTSASQQFNIGNRLVNYERAWNGRLAEFAYWSTILAPGQVADLALGAPAHRHNLSSLQLYLPLLGHSADRINATPGTVAGTPTPSFNTDHPRMI